MAFGFFMNMEKLAINISRDHVANMTNDNMSDGFFFDEEKLMNNIKNGFVVITQLNTFLESFLNTILNNCMEYDGDVLYKCSVEEKLDIIFMYYKMNWSKIKGQHPWGVYRKTTKVRNEMIHFKKTYIGDGSEIPNFDIAGISINEFFTKNIMDDAIQQYIKLGNLIAGELGLNICHDISVFECDARDELVNYVYDRKVGYIDESRLCE